MGNVGNATLVEYSSVATKILATLKTDWLVALSCILHCYYILQERRNKDLLANISTAVKISQC